MTSFILAAIVLLAITLALLTHPWWSARRRAADTDQDALNSAIYRDQLAELERDLQQGLLSAEDHATARAEIRRRVIEDTTGETLPATRTPGRATLLALLVCLPLLAGVIYIVLGTPIASIPPSERAAEAAANMEKMLATLIERVAREPQNTEARIMLARTYKMLGRLDEADQAFAAVGAPLDESAALLAEYAEVLILKTNRFDGKPRELLARALQRDAEHPLALVLAGTDAFQQRRWETALSHWERLYKQLEPGSEEAQVIEASLARVREELGKGKPGAGKAADAASLRGRVDIAPALRNRVSPDDVVFVFARAVDGPRMPLAALKARVADLPLDFALGDAQALRPEARLSGASEVIVEARVARGGNATAAKGDLAGQSKPVKPGAKGVKISIDRVIE